MPEYDLPAVVCGKCGSPVARSNGFCPRCGCRIGSSLSNSKIIAAVILTLGFMVAGLFSLALAACAGTSWNSNTIPPITMTVMVLISVVLLTLWILAMKAIFK